MPPRYAYWTILIGDEPTAFRASALEDIMPTFNRLKEKQPTAVLKWFQNGKLWASRIDAREAMDYRGDKGKRHDPKQKEAGYQGWKGKPAIADSTGERKPFTSPTGKAPRGERAKPDWKPKGEVRPEWKPKGEAPTKPRWKKPEGFSAREPKPDWKPKSAEGEKPAWSPKPSRPQALKPSSEGGKPAWKPRGATGEKPAWKPRGATGEKPAWKPKSAAFARGDKPEWKKKPAFGDKKPYGAKPAWKPKGEGFSARGPKPEWKPRGESSSPKPQAPGRERSERPAWQPKAAARPVERQEKPEWKPKTAPRSAPSVTGRSDVRDKKWRPGGEHQDPRQKFKDAKKAKWTRFKQAIRARTGHKKKPE